MNAMKRLLWWLLAGSVGGVNRGWILDELFQTPCQTTLKHPSNPVQTTAQTPCSNTKFKCLYI